MLECIILGDSIAVGTQLIYNECTLYGKNGINTYQWNRVYPSISQNAKVAVISLGTNDYRGLNTKEELKTVRKKITAEKVYWILPFGNNKSSGISVSDLQNAVREVAGSNSDTVVEIESISFDGVHPSNEGYRKIVKKIKP